MAWARPRMRALQLHLEVKARWLVVEAAAVVVIVNGHRAVLVRQLQHPAAVERDGWHSPHASGSAQVAAGRGDPGDGDSRHYLVASGCHRHHCRRAGCGQNKWFQLHMACRSWRLHMGSTHWPSYPGTYIVGRGSFARRTPARQAAASAGMPVGCARAAVSVHHGWPRSWSASCMSSMYAALSCHGAARAALSGNYDSGRWLQAAIAIARLCQRCAHGKCLCRIRNVCDWNCCMHSTLY